MDAAAPRRAARSRLQIRSPSTRSRGTSRHRELAASQPTEAAQSEETTWRSGGYNRFLSPLPLAAWPSLLARRVHAPSVSLLFPVAGVPTHPDAICLDDGEISAQASAANQLGWRSLRVSHRHSKRSPSLPHRSPNRRSCHLAE